MHTSTNAFIGVQCSRGKCRGRIRHGDKFKFTRWYDSPIDAAIARDTLAVQCYRDNAVLNFTNNNEGHVGS